VPAGPVRMDVAPAGAPPARGLVGWV
jgi:hypothetical protein